MFYSDCGAKQYSGLEGPVSQIGAGMVLKTKIQMVGDRDDLQSFPSA